VKFSKSILDMAATLSYFSTAGPLGGAVSIVETYGTLVNVRQQSDI
jgi:hypothetical protein